jgi:hypothetical protein
VPHRSAAAGADREVIQAAGLQLADDASIIRPASPDLLVSERRRQIINQRDQYRAATD